MNHRNLLLILFLLLLTPGFSQQYRAWEDDDPKARPQKVGVRIGSGTSWLYAPEMRKGTPQTGVQGAMYYRVNFGKHFHLQTEFGAAYRGQNYPSDDNDTGYYYTRIGLFYLELPVLAMISFDEAQKHNLLIGPSLGYLLKPSMFIRSPQFSRNFPTFTTLPIKKWEIGLSAGYLFSTKYVGLYAGVKFGLNNLAGDFTNLNIPRDFGNDSPQTLEEVSPSLKTVKTIQNRCIELSLYF